MVSLGGHRAEERKYSNEIEAQKVSWNIPMLCCQQTAGSIDPFELPKISDFWVSNSPVSGEKLGLGRSNNILFSKWFPNWQHQYHLGACQNANSQAPSHTY